MATLLGSLLVTLGLDSGQFKSGLTQSEKELRTAQRRIQKIGDNLVGLGGKLSLVVSAPLLALGKAAVSAAIESQEAIGQVNAALASMGDAAGRTSQQLQDLATGEMRKSLFDDDDILRQVTANLLTFGKVSGEVFDRAQQAALDMSARLGQDLQSSAIQVGKALNDPVKGLTALGRVGVQFTTQQKEQIKSMVELGNVAGAQGIILGELARQFGGAAEAQRKANPTAAMKQSWEEFKETLGAKLLPLLPRITDFLTKMLDAFGKLSPGMQTAVVVGGALAVALGPVLIAVGAMLPLLTALAPVVVAFGVALIGVAANPVVLGMAAVLIGIVYAARHWDEITAIAKRLYQGIKTWLLDKLNAVWAPIKEKIDLVKGWFHGLYDAVVGHSYIPDMVDGIAAEIARLDAVLVAPVERATSKAKEAFRKLAQDTRDLFAELFPEIDRANAFIARGEQIKGLKVSDEAKQEMMRRSSNMFGHGTVSDTELPEPTFGNTDLLGAALPNVDAQLEQVAKALDTTKSKWGEWGDAAHEAFSEISHQLSGVLLGFQSLGDAIRNVIARLADRALDAAFDLLGKSLHIPGFATGTNFAPGGLAIVGERGPELVNLPRGSQVVPNHELAGMGGQQVHKPTFVFPGITNAKEAREAAGQAARRYRRELNPMRQVA